MKLIGFFLLIGGLVAGGVGIWRKMNPGGPMFYGKVTDSIKDLYGVPRPGNLPIIVGVFLILIGLILLILA